MTPLERVSRALCEADNLAPNEQVPKPEPVQYMRSRMRPIVPTCARWETYQYKARLALDAIREPSEVMYRATSDDDGICDNYRAMIDAALEEV